MSEWTHIRQFDGFSRGPLIDSIRPFPDQIRYSLRTMDGAKHWGFSLWRAPEGADLLEDIPLSEEYIQCAGSAEAMTVEVRILDADGTARQYVVGKQGLAPSGAPGAIVRWDAGRHSVTVHPHEVFTADEAAEVVYAYFLTDRVSEPYVLRELDLT